MNLTLPWIQIHNSTLTHQNLVTWSLSSSSSISFSFKSITKVINHFDLVSITLLVFLKIIFWLPLQASTVFISTNIVCNFLGLISAGNAIKATFTLIIKLWLTNVPAITANAITNWDPTMHNSIHEHTATTSMRVSPIHPNYTMGGYTTVFFLLGVLLASSLSILTLMAAPVHSQSFSCLHSGFGIERER